MLACFSTGISVSRTVIAIRLTARTLISLSALAVPLLPLVLQPVPLLPISTTARTVIAISTGRTLARILRSPHGGRTVRGRRVVCACARTRNAGGRPPLSAGYPHPLAVAPYHPVPREREDRGVARTQEHPAPHGHGAAAACGLAVEQSGRKRYPSKPEQENVPRQKRCGVALRRRMKRRAAVPCRPGTARWSMRSRRSCCAFRCVRACVRACVRLQAVVHVCICALARVCVSLQALE